MGFRVITVGSHEVHHFPRNLSEGVLLLMAEIRRSPVEVGS